MKRIWTILRRDLISTSRDAMLMYIVLAPLIIGLGVRIFLPSVGGVSINLVTSEQTPAALREHLAAYGKLHTVRDEAALEQRVLAIDEAVGVVPDGSGGYTVLLEGNESEASREFAMLVVNRIASGQPLPDAAVVEVGEARVPYREWIGVFMSLTALFFGAMVMGFHIVEDKETGVIRAMGVSPLNRRTYLAARSVWVLLLAQVTVFGGLLALGVTQFNAGQIAVIAAVGAIVGVLFGFLMGAMSANQIAAFAFVKIGFLPLILPAAAALLLPDGWEPAVYWAPTYWAFEAFRRVLIDGAGWPSLWAPLAWTLGLSVVFGAVAYPFLRGKLDFAQE